MSDCESCICKKFYEKQYEAFVKYREKNHLKFLLASAKQSAKKRGIEFTITESELEIPDRCKYLGVELTSIQGKGRVDTNMSLDRIDSSLGYVPGNVQIISDLANRMKSSADPDMLIRFAEGIIKNK